MAIPQRISRVAKSELFRDSVGVALATAVSKLALVGKDLLVAYVFGLGGEIDRFLAAYAIPFFLGGLFVASASASIIPTFVHLREKEGRAPAQPLLSNLTALSWVFALVGALLLLILRRPLLAAFMPHASRINPSELGRSYSALVIAFACMVVSSPWTAVLQAQRRFVAISLVSLATTTSIVVCVVLRLGTSVGSIALGTVVGSLAEALITAYLLLISGYSPRARWIGWDAPTRKVLSQYLPLLGGSILSSGSPIVDQLFAVRLHAAGLSALSYGGKLTTLGLALPATALGLTLLPKFSSLVACQDHENLSRLLWRLTAGVFLVSAPVVAVLWALSPWLVRTIYMHGAITSQDAYLVTRIQRFYLLQIPFFLTASMCGRMAVALGRSHILLFISIAFVVMNLGTDVLFSRLLGVAGIALSTSVCVSLVFLVYVAIWWRWSPDDRSNALRGRHVAPH